MADISRKELMMLLHGMERPRLSGFNLSGLAIGSQVIVGFAVNCANDVIYQSVAVPEPSTALILGVGLVLLARRRA